MLLVSHLMWAERGGFRRCELGHGCVLQENTGGGGSTHVPLQKCVKSEATAYLGEGFLWISKKWSLPGEQTSALYSHSHVRQLELNNVKNTGLDLKRSRFIKKVFIWFISFKLFTKHQRFSISCFSNVKLCCFSLFHVTVNWISLTSESLCDVFKWKLWWTFFKIMTLFIYWLGKLLKYCEIL